jgi:small GTP-binding protein
MDTKVFKVILVGDASVGKTSIVNQFAEGTYEDNCGNTVGVDLKIKTISYKGEQIKLQIWDTAGQERYRNLAETYFKGTHGVILVYDLTSPTSFESL